MKTPLHYVVFSLDARYILYDVGKFCKGGKGEQRVITYKTVEKFDKEIRVAYIQKIGTVDGA